LQGRGEGVGSGTRAQNFLSRKRKEKRKKRGEPQAAAVFVHPRTVRHSRASEKADPEEERPGTGLHATKARRREGSKGRAAVTLTRASRIRRPAGTRPRDRGGNKSSELSRLPLGRNSKKKGRRKEEGFFLPSNGLAIINQLRRGGGSSSEGPKGKGKMRDRTCQINERGLEKKMRRSFRWPDPACNG